MLKRFYRKLFPKYEGLPFKIIGPGVMSVKVEDIFKNPKSIRQIEACRHVKMHNPVRGIIND